MRVFNDDTGFSWIGQPPPETNEGLGDLLGHDS